MKVKSLKQWHKESRIIASHMTFNIRCIDSLLAYGVDSYTAEQIADMKAQKDFYIHTLKIAYLNRNREFLIEFYNDVMRKKGL